MLSLQKLYVFQKFSINKFYLIFILFRSLKMTPVRCSLKQSIISSIMVRPQKMWNISFSQDLIQTNRFELIIKFKNFNCFTHLFLFCYNRAVIKKNIHQKSRTFSPQGYILPGFKFRRISKFSEGTYYRRHFVPRF